MNPRIRRIVGIPGGVFLAASAVFAQSAPPPAPTATLESQLARPVKSPGNAKWADTDDEARARAAAEKKFVFYEFTKDKCGECKRMDALLYPAFDFEALLIPMVPLKIVYDSPASKPFQEKYRVSDAPAILITTPEGRLVFFMQGFQNAPDFYQHVHESLDRYRQFAKKVDAQDVATLSASEALATGRELFERKDPKAAQPRLKRASVAPNPEPGVRESALEGLAAVELELGNASNARLAIDKLIATTKDADQKERAEIFRAQIPLWEQNPREALALFQKFAKDHPQSKYLPQVQSFIARLENAAAPK